jgi:hypothetical protein
MPSTVARSKTDVENMDKRQRLWDSLDYSYGVKADRSDEQFRQAYSQADRQMLGRGMQRSSYGAQTLANLDQQRIRARNDIESEKIADYENRLQDIEQQEQQQANWQAQFDEGVRQFNTNFGYQKERDLVGDQQWQKQFDQSGTQADRQLAAGYVSSIIANGQDPTDELLARAGLSRADANAMKAQIAEGGGGGGYSSGGGGGRGGNNPPPKTNPDYNTGDSGLDNFLRQVDSLSGLSGFEKGLVKTSKTADVLNKNRR